MEAWKGSGLWRKVFLKGEAHLGLSNAKHLLTVGDGSDRIEVLAGHNRWRATYQLDWWHLKRGFQATFHQYPVLALRLDAPSACGPSDVDVQASRWPRRICCEQIEACRL